MAYMLCLIFMMIFGSMALVMAFGIISFLFTALAFVLGFVAMFLRLFFKSIYYSLKRILRL